MLVELASMLADADDVEVARKLADIVKEQRGMRSFGGPLRRKAS